MVQVERLAVEVSASLADFKKLFDLGVRYVEIDRRRAATQAALRNGEGQAVHHADERDDAAGFAVQADRFANAAHAAPISADAAAAACEPDILVPRIDDALKAVIDRIEIARDRQAASGAAVREHRRCGHEPELGDIIIQTLRVILIISISGCDAREQVLVIFTR